jgi:hypothetical protein
VLLFDESFSIPVTPEFAQMMASAANLVDRFNPYMANSYASLTGLLIGLTSFADSSQTILNLNRFTNTIVNAINNNTRSGGGTYLDLGLQQSASVLTGTNSRALPKKILVYTDGAPSDEANATKKATEIKTTVYNGQRIEILAIGINISASTQTYLQNEIVSKNNYFFNSDTFNIIQLNAAIALALCETGNPILNVVVDIAGPSGNPESACLLTPAGVKYCLSPIILKPGLVIYDDPNLTIRSYTSNPGGYTVLTYESIQYVLTFDSEGLVDTIQPCSVSITPSPTISVTPSITPTTGLPPSETPSNTPTISITPSITPTKTETPAPTPSVTTSITPSNTAGLPPSITPTITISPSITPSLTSTPDPTPPITPTTTNTPNPITPTPSITPTRSQVPVELGYNCPCTGVVPGGTFSTFELCMSVCFPTPTPSVTPTSEPAPSVTPTSIPAPSVTPSTTTTPSCVCWSFENSGGTTGNVSFVDCNSGATNTSIDIGETIYKCVVYGTTPSLNSGIIDITPLGTACNNQGDCAPGGGGGS